jgi:energy-coupling factor transport system substrate-specific component
MSDEITERESLDHLVDDLGRLRLAAGDVSYAEIANRIARRREARGLSPEAARVARSSVFDAFKTGRSRINADLVAEIAQALGLDDAEAERWRARCLRARAASRAPRLPVDLPTGVGPRFSPAFVVVFMIACGGINHFGGALTEKFQIPLWLDMTGTAIAAIVLGPWQGAIVGLSNNLLGALVGDFETLPFALVNVVGALLWGYGARRFGLASSVLRMLLLNLIVAVACTITAVPLNVLLLNGQPIHASHTLINTLLSLGEGVWVAVFSANIVVSIIDKQISGFVALALARLIQRRQNRDTGLSPG